MNESRRSTPDLVPFLRGMPLFADLNDRALTALARASRAWRVPKGKTLFYPSLHSSVISVAAHEGRDPFTFYYNPAPPVEFGAPGIDVNVAWINKQYSVSTGNSFAAPHIAGIVALIHAKHPELTLSRSRPCCSPARPIRAALHLHRRAKGHGNRIRVLLGGIDKPYKMRKTSSSLHAVFMFIWHTISSLHEEG